MRALPLLALAAALVSPACFFYVRPRSDGPTLFRVENCANCHGPNGVGSPNGPTLVGLERNWDPETLNAFLADPEAWRERVPRLAELARAHRNRMPSFSHLSDRERSKLATHLLRP